ncbi:hypothetical protein WN51_08973 [Melipona quadrifasciata]|uniref:Uncharacterized protein n=1 Tax=Melipona quadrifasciata TaxID=166423 RepID=A0A0N0BBQ8_9HYME|nr:hypothetical protein WN51_08973 [Melipona quadrifasciata]
MIMTTPYVDAIQAIPGDNPGKKFRWMATFIREKLSVSDNLESIIESNQIPTILAPLILIEAAIALNKKDPKNQNAHLAIAEALKSTDAMIVSKAFRARHFFDGTNKSIVNMQYFAENIFPYVSMKTRTRIIKTLAYKLLPKKNFDLVKEFYVGVEALYGIKQALPLLLACDDSFIYDTIVQKRIVLSEQQIKQILYRSPDLVVRYIKLSQKTLTPHSRNIHPVSIYNLSNILALLFKKRRDAFIELCEIYEKHPPNVVLSNKMAALFLKNCIENLYEKPRLFIEMLPLNKISSERMENIYLKLFPENIRNFSTDDMLKYLAYYPSYKKTKFFLESYRQMYGKNILDEPEKVTVTLMKLLPAEERIRQAKIKIEKESNYSEYSSNELYQVCCINCWDCYLSVEVSIPQFKKEISAELEMKCRATIACKMIYSCYVNDNKSALLEVLTYLKNRHSNEQPWFMLQVFNTLLIWHDLPFMDSDCWLVLRKMILNANAKGNLLFDVETSVLMIEAAVHHNILRNKNIDLLINIFVNLKISSKTNRWNILRQYPEYEKVCLQSCIKFFSKKFDSESDQSSWKENKVEFLYDLCASIYLFNKTHAKKHSQVKAMSIANYPWLMRSTERFFVLGLIQDHTCQKFRQLLLKNDVQLYKRFWPHEKKSMILTGEVFKILKKNPKTILNTSKDYLKACVDHWHKNHTRRFLKALRWYKEIPIHFVKQCFQDLSQTDEPSCLNVLATLVHGKTFSKIIEPLIAMIHAEHVEKNDTINFELIYRIVSSMRYANPPVSLTVLSKLCDIDSFLSAPVIPNVCRRASVMDVTAFAEKLSTQKVGLQKYGIRLINLVETRKYILHFLCTQWKSKQHPYSIRNMLFSMIMKFFVTQPEPATWSLFFEAISTLTVEYSKVFPELIITISSTPDQYVADYIKQLVDTIDNFENAGLNNEQIARYTSELLSHINTAVCDLLPEYFVENLIRKYLFHEDIQISQSATVFIITSLLTPSEVFGKRLELFSSVFMDVVTSGWDMPHPQYSLFYPVNNGFYRFIGSLLGIFPFIPIESQLIDELLTTFDFVIEPQMDPTSFLILTYCKEVLNSTTPKEFGLNVGKKIDKLVEIFTPFFLFFMADVLINMPMLNLFDSPNNNELYFGIVEGLLEVDTESATLLATKLFKIIKPSQEPQKYTDLLKKFLKYDSTAITSSICDICNNLRCMDEVVF